jgi:hypothetical protein
MLYPRSLTEEIKEYLCDKEAIIILGARQVGKTSLLNLIMNELKDKEPVFYFDLESPRELAILNEGVENFLSYLRSLGAEKSRRSFVFIDEIQYLSEPSRFLKLLVDHHSHLVKVIATGSSSLYIRLKFKDSLVGRKFVFYLYPLSFKEFLIFKSEDRLSYLLPDELKLTRYQEARYFSQDYWRYFKEFLVFGGYPRIVLEENIDKKVKILGEIISSYIYKDVKALFELEDVTKFNKLVQLLATSTGNLLNETSISNAVALARATVKRYLSILSETFILYLLPPFYKNKKKEITKAHKVYLLDNGILNYLTGNLSLETVDTGRMLENAVFTSLLKKKKEQDALYFWRTQAKTEIDFILKTKDKIIPIEVKSKAESKRPLYSFMDEYKIEKGIMVKGSSEFEEEKNIITIPAWWIV